MPSITVSIRDELTRRACTSLSARRAELATLLRFGSGLHVLNGRGVRGGPHRWTIRVSDDAETLARQTGLLDRRGRPVIGLPAEVVGGRAEDAAAAWRGAFLACGAVRDTGQSSAVVIECPGPEAALALVGAARRLGIKARNHEQRTTRLVAVRDDDAISGLLIHMGLEEAVRNWREHRAARTERISVRPANFDDANQRRANHAAAATSAQVQWALQVLGDTAPAQWVTTGLLRLQHREATLEQLGRLADPPMSKHAVAGHIRRLIAMADRTVGRDGFLTDLRPAAGPLPHQPGSFTHRTWRG